ncbi:corrinoid adenosyltransferase-like [Chelonus insularis]|uniref:corrinoid adenosyltransferase-like n=1 Tax=Chelonus insularis TaxID=460826 RepID=UPI00158A253E|nr:corrinoid adenosyltransferase-like [Chelonus insularis]
MEVLKYSWKKYLFVYKNHLNLLFQSHAPNLISTHAAYFSNNNKPSSSPSSNTHQTCVNDHTSNAMDTTDELSSFIGLAGEFACETTAQHPYIDKLKRVQTILFEIRNAISKSSANKRNSFENKHTKDLEEWILEYANQLPPPEDYIIPGGGKASASLHVARAICKRAEKSLIPLIHQGLLDEETQRYLNRLAEFLFTVSRIAAKCDQRTESIYIPRADNK